MTMPLITKTTAIIITTLGIILALELSKLTHTFTKLLSSGQNIASHLIDLSWYKKMDPEGLATLQLKVAKISTTIHTGLIKTYLGSFALSIFIIILSTQN